MARSWRGIWLFVPGVLFLIAGLVVFITDPGGITPALLIGALLVVIGLFVRGNATDPNGPSLPPRPDERS
jgi:hypothetical protein